MLEKFGGRNIRWALSESLLVDGRKVVCCPGGKKIAMVALDKDTGETLWTCAGAGDVPAYATAILVDFSGLRQIVTMTGASAIGVAADTGKLLWRYEHKVAYEAACASPIFHEGRLAMFGTWGRGATMLRLTVQGRACKATEVWRTKELDNEHGGVVLVDGFLYGQSDGNHKQRHWTCLELATGKTMWSVGGLPGRSGTLTYADGMLYVMSDQRVVALVPASPKAWKIVSRFELPRGGRGNTWAHPVVCGGRLYLRHGDFLYVYDVRAAG
jgi:outer membrane protein assembly factor BamB